MTGMGQLSVSDLLLRGPHPVTPALWRINAAG